MRPALCAALILVVPASLDRSVEARDSLPAQSTARPLLWTTPPTKESFAERKAVRGVALEGSESSESPELRALRHFEEQAFPRHGAAPPNTELPDDAAQPLPPGLEGRWGGTGDIPRELRSPERGLAPPPQKPDLDWMRQLVPPDLPVRWEPQVVRYLEFFKNDPKGRAIMTTWLRKMGRYRVVIEQKLDEQGLPKDLHLPGHGRKRVRSRGDVAKERGRSLAVHPRRRARLRP